MTSDEIARTVAAMDKVEPFDMTDEERAEANPWEKKVNIGVTPHKLRPALR